MTATARKLMIEPTIVPMANVDTPPESVGTAHTQLLRSPTWKTTPMSGLMKPSTRAFTIAVNAAPMTTATARSMTLPRRMNSLKPLITWYPPGCRPAADRAPDQAPDDAGEDFASVFDDVEVDEEAPPE